MIDCLTDWLTTYIDCSLHDWPGCLILMSDYLATWMTGRIVWLPLHSNPKPNQASDMVDVRLMHLVPEKKQVLLNRVHHGGSLRSCVTGTIVIRTQHVNAVECIRV